MKHLIAKLSGIDFRKWAIVSLFILSVVVRWVGGSFAFFEWLCVSAKMQMCLL